MDQFVKLFLPSIHGAYWDRPGRAQAHPSPGLMLQTALGLKNGATAEAVLRHLRGCAVCRLIAPELVAAHRVCAHWAEIFSNVFGIPISLEEIAAARRN